MGILFFIFNLLMSSPTESDLNQISRQDSTTLKEVNVGNTIVDDLNSLIR